MSEEDKLEQPIIVKKIKKGGGHHGGAWKVAYADFVTAMMAFFLLLWLLNVSTDEQRNAISNFFDPSHPKVSRMDSGAGGVLGGLSMSTKGAMVTNVQPITQPTPTGTAGSSLNAAKATSQTGGDLIPDQKQSNPIEAAKEEMRKEEEERLKEAEEALKKAIEDDEELNALKDQFLVDMTPEGLRIQVIDKDGNPMFATGSAQMFEKTQKLLLKVGDIIKGQPNEISIRGHTDSVAYAPGATYTNWELSADRANSSRRVLLDTGFAPERMNNVVGKAATEPLIEDDPENAANRRISIILLKEELTNPDYTKKAAERAGIDPSELEPPVQQEKQPVLPKMGTFKRTPGAVEFP